MSLRSILRSIWTAGRGVLVGLPEATETSDPFELFGAWLEAAEASGIIEPTAMTLATATADGIPSARTVLLKAFDEEGFVFYTNYGSRKASQLAENDQASLVFYWPVLARQVCIDGRVERISRETSAAYFATRARGSQLGAWASRQSEPLESRDELLRQYDEQKRRFEGRDVECPPFWGGYVLIPKRIQFWQGRADRLHDRVLFERGDDGWKATRLSP
jgi:pyridoxamine 5'-phosphate oxidase